jgi:hypothetical protein
VLTLGTGVGSAIFSNGALTPHLELAHNTDPQGRDLQRLCRQRRTPRAQQQEVEQACAHVIEHVYSLLHYDVLYLGGGNAARVTVALPDNVHIASNDAGITGGIRLWMKSSGVARPRRDACQPSGRCSARDEGALVSYVTGCQSIPSTSPGYRLSGLVLLLGH